MWKIWLKSIDGLINGLIKNTLLLADVFEHFRDKCIEIYELDLAHFLSAPGLAWQASLKKTGVKLELLTDDNMLLMVEESIRGGICIWIIIMKESYHRIWCI